MPILFIYKLREGAVRKQANDSVSGASPLSMNNSLITLPCMQGFSFRVVHYHSRYNSSPEGASFHKCALMNAPEMMVLISSTSVPYLVGVTQQLIRLSSKVSL